MTLTAEKRAALRPELLAWLILDDENPPPLHLSIDFVPSPWFRTFLAEWKGPVVLDFRRPLSS